MVRCAVLMMCASIFSPCTSSWFGLLFSYLSIFLLKGRHEVLGERKEVREKVLSEGFVKLVLFLPEIINDVIWSFLPGRCCNLQI